MKKFILATIATLFLTNAYPFDVYQFIIWKNYIDDKGQLRTDQKELQKYFAKNNLKPVKVIYHNRFLTKGKPDEQKIKIIANATKTNTSVPVSFDIEVGDKFKTQTLLPIVNETLDLYHKHGGAAPVGVYGVLPQIIFADEQFNSNTKKRYIQLNKEAEEIANKVDFLSPVLYNTWITDFDEWKNRTEFQMSQARSYAKKYNLKIIPYVSGTYLDRGFFKNKIIHPLSETEMKQRLDYIKSKGANGVIVWEGSTATLKNGENPTYDKRSGAYKVITQFANQK